MIDPKFFNKMKVGSHWINKINNIIKNVIHQEKMSWKQEIVFVTFEMLKTNFIGFFWFWQCNKFFWF